MISSDCVHQTQILLLLFQKLKGRDKKNRFVCICPQERQRLETILNLCAEYNKGESSGLEPLSSGRTGFPGVLTDSLGQRPPMDSVLGGTPSSAALRLLQKQRESDEENLKEECSSTESTHQEVRTSPAPSAPSALLNGDRQVRGDARFPSKALSAWDQHVQTMCSASLNQPKHL